MLATTRYAPQQYAQVAGLPAPGVSTSGQGPGFAADISANVNAGASSSAHVQIAGLLALALLLGVFVVGRML